MDEAKDPKARGGVRRYLDTVPPAEYVPDTGEVDLAQLSLTGLADLFGSDKGAIKHNYTPVYERIIEDLCQGTDRQNAKLRLVEFGVACGASLRMWSNYLPQSDILGLDIREECALLCSDAANVEIRIENPTAWTPDGAFDLIIDDASHISEQIVAALRASWPALKGGGYYVVEDLSCTYSEQYTENFRRSFDPEVVNDRSVVLKLLDEVMRVVDARGDIEKFEYTPQMLVLKKAA